MGLNTLPLEMSMALSNFVNTKTSDGTKLNSQLRRDLLNYLLKYYQYHITKNKKIKSVEILSELLS